MVNVTFKTITSQQFNIDVDGETVIGDLKRNIEQSQGANDYPADSMKLIYNGKLYLDGCTRVDEMAIEDLCTNSSQLKELRLNDCYRITDSCISMISRTMSDLQAITLCGDGFKELSSFLIFHASRVSSRLRELIKTMERFDYNPLVCDELIGHLVENAKGLRCVSLANSGSDQSISTDGLRKLANLRDLEQVDLSSLAAVRSPVLVDLCSKCTKLELIQITSNSIQEIIKAFPSTTGLSTITVVVGGTAAETGELRVRGSRVAIDFSDYSALVGMATSQSATSSYSLAPHNSHLMSKSMSSSEFSFEKCEKLGDSDDDVSEDDFDVLTAQRSFYIDAVYGEDDSPVLESKTEILEWATKEAKNLGLIKP